jgi:uncharacterized iron-regulated protein
MHLTPRAAFTAMFAFYGLFALSTLATAQVGCPGTSPGEIEVRQRASTWPTLAHPLSFTILIGGKSPDDQREALRCGFVTDLAILAREIAGNLVHPGSVVLLGEVHDNPLHHLIRAHLLNLSKAIAFEQIRADQQRALDAFTALPPEARTTADLLHLLDWDKSAWSKTADYKPLFAAALAANRPILAADPPRDLMRAAGKTGLSAIPAEERTRLGLDTPLSDAQNAASLAEIEASHCGAIPKSAHPNMAYAQRYRDAHMAEALIQAADKHGGATLIAGNGHVRLDRGVPWYLRQRAPNKKVISVLFVEVEEGKNGPDFYVERDPDGKLVADYIVFTPKPVREVDPCEAMLKPPADAKPSVAPSSER